MTSEYFSKDICPGTGRRGNGIRTRNSGNMKLTKPQLKQIIKEELEGDKALLRAIDRLTQKIEALDVSVDFLAASLVGGDAYTIGAQQAAVGRGYPASGTGIKIRKEHLKQIIKKELGKVLNEVGFGQGKPAKDGWSKKRQIQLEDDAHPGQSCDEAHAEQTHEEWAEKEDLEETKKKRKN